MDVLQQCAQRYLPELRVRLPIMFYIVLHLGLYLTARLNSTPACSRRDGLFLLSFTQAVLFRVIRLRPKEIMTVTTVFSSAVQ